MESYQNLGIAARPILGCVLGFGQAKHGLITFEGKYSVWVPGSPRLDILHEY